MTQSYPNWTRDELITNIHSTYKLAFGSTPSTKQINMYNDMDDIELIDVYVGLHRRTNYMFGDE